MAGVRGQEFEDFFNFLHPCSRGQHCKILVKVDIRAFYGESFIIFTFLFTMQT